MKYINLYNGVKVPEIGFGTWHIKEEKTLENSISWALESGYKHIDTASKYCNEEFIGKTLKKLKIPRDEIFITSKLWNTDKGYNQTIKAFNETLKRLKTDYLDLYLIHWPKKYKNWKEDNIETWKAMEMLYKQGKIKAIGVSNFLVQHLEALLKDIDIPPMINQIEYHPGFMQKETVEYCKKNNIIIEAWSPLGSGSMLDNEQLKEIANKYNKSVAQICIKWCLQNGIVTLPKSTNKDRIKENINVYNFNISTDDMNFINSMECFSSSGLNPNKIFE